MSIFPMGLLTDVGTVGRLLAAATFLRPGISTLLTIHF
jgi:hypothetical protein